MESIHSSNCALGLLEYQQWEQFKRERWKLALKNLLCLKPFLILDLIFNGGEAFFFADYHKVPPGVGCLCDG